MTAPEPDGRGDIRTRFAGFAAVFFVVCVVLQNIARGSSAPENGASGEDVLAHYADEGALTYVLIASFALNAVALATFLGGTMRRLLASGRPGWAIMGGAGAVSVIALFSVVVAAEQALSVIAGYDGPDIGAVEGLWAFHHSVFTLLNVSLGIALVGLARAGVAAGLTPRIFDRLAPAGAVLLGIGAAAGPAIAAGDAMPLFGLAGLGFLVWLAFLVTTGLRLIRS